MRTFDQEFIQRCKKHDKSAQKKLFEELYAPLVRSASRYLTDLSEAEDCVMKGLLKAFLNIRNFTYQEPQGLHLWIRRIVINEALMVLRKRRNFFLSLEEELSSTGIENEALDKIAVEELNQLIMRLPEGYRTVFCLYVVDGYSHADIASQLGISENTSRTQLSKARNKLKLLIERRENVKPGFGG
jgi:RNA polymerase sigma factor (sigma-70 family)